VLRPIFFAKKHSKDPSRVKKLLFDSLGLAATFRLDAAEKVIRFNENDEKRLDASNRVAASPSMRF
jgi:hypothetical protein